MSRLGIRALSRILLLLVASSALAALSLRTLTTAHRPTSIPAAEPGLSDLIELTAWCALLGVSIWATALFVTMLAGSLTGHALPVPCPRSWRPTIAALCGIGAAVGIALPAGASQAPAQTARNSAQTSSTGALPSLGRPMGAESSIPTDTIVVRAGDSLWSLVVRRHPHENAAVTARRVARLHRSNLDTIGPDADLIRPGQRLRPDDSDPATTTRETSR